MVTCHGILWGSGTKNEKLVPSSFPLCAGVCFCSSTCVSVCIIVPLTGFGMFFFLMIQGFPF